MAVGDGDAAARYLEEQKLAFELVKHIATLSTGTIVLLATLLKDVFEEPRWRGLIPVVFASLAISLVALTFTALGLMSSVRNPGSVSPAQRRLTGGTMLAGVGGFLLGLLVLAVFATRNWV